jgi:anthranilate synthase component I
VSAPLYQPSREEFASSRRDHAVVPVWREVLADLRPRSASTTGCAVTATGPTFLLESVEHGEHWGRYSFIGLDPFLELRRARRGR